MKGFWMKTNYDIIITGYSIDGKDRKAKMLNFSLFEKQY